ARPVPAIVYAPRAGDLVAGEGRAIVSAPTAAELVAHARPRRLRPTPLPPPQVRAVRSALLGAAAAAIAVVAGVATMAVGGDQPVHFTALEVAPHAIPAVDVHIDPVPPPSLAPPPPPSPPPASVAPPPPPPAPPPPAPAPAPPARQF